MDIGSASCTEEGPPSSPLTRPFIALSLTRPPPRVRWDPASREWRQTTKLKGRQASAVADRDTAVHPPVPEDQGVYREVCAIGRSGWPLGRSRTWPNVQCYRSLSGRHASPAITVIVAPAIQNGPVGPSHRASPPPSNVPIAAPPRASSA